MLRVYPAKGFRSLRSTVGALKNRIVYLEYKHIKERKFFKFSIVVWNETKIEEDPFNSEEEELLMCPTPLTTQSQTS